MRLIILILLILLASGCAQKSLLSPEPQGIKVEQMFEQSQPLPPQKFSSKSSSTYTGWNTFWLGSAVVGQGFDGFSTIDGLNGGKCKEANPIFVDNPDDAVIIGSKLLVLGVATWLAEYHLAGNPRQQEYRNYIYAPVAIIGGAAGIYNSQQSCD